MKAKHINLNNNPIGIHFKDNKLSFSTNDSGLLSKVKEHAAKKLEKALECAQLGLWEYDTITNNISFNDSYAKILGYTSRELHAYGTYGIMHELIHPEDLEKAIDAFSKMLSGEKNEFHFNMRMLNKNKQYIWIFSNGSASEWDEIGTPVKYMGIMKDNSEAKTIEKEKEKLYKELARKKETYEERIKEQQLLYTVFNLLNSNKNVNTTLNNIVSLLPSGCRLPDEISARITFDNVTYCTEQFNESFHFLNSSFQTLSGKQGQIELFYKNELSEKTIGPSFTEAHNLIDTLSVMLKSWLDKRETERNLQNMLVELEGKIEERTQELKKANGKLISINKDISDSINYANRIQRAILPTESMVNEAFDEAFILYLPKDIISGDFYWLHNSGDKVFYVCADCTGHGVPGALMSMVGNQLLDYIITDRKIDDAEMILHEIDRSITKMFQKGNIEEGLRDGMSLSLCIVDKSNKTVSFAGAYNNAYIFRNDEILVLEADRFSIGGHGDEIKPFHKSVISYEKGDSLYMFTDGLPDQFGGPKGKKLMRKNVLELIKQNTHESFSTQGKIYEHAFKKWKGDQFQVDDVTLLGVKL